MEKNKHATKILIATPLYPPEIGGPATYCCFLEKKLPKEDFTIEIIRFSDVRCLPYIVRHIAYFWKVFARAKNFDIVYALDPLGVGVPSGVASKIRGKKFFMRIAGDRAWETAAQKYNIKDSLDVFSLSRKYNFEIMLMKLAQTIGTKMADKIIVPSEYLRTIVSNWGVRKEKIKVIYNAVEPIFVPEHKDELQEVLGMKWPVLFSAGRIVAWKGFFSLVAIMPEIIKEFPNAQLYIAGDGPDFTKLSEEINKNSLADRIILLGRINEETIARYMKASDVFILNTFYEGFSHQLLEAMYRKIPIVTTNSGGNPELIENEKDGILVDYNDSPKILDAIKKILNDKGFSAEIILHATEKIKKFSSESVINSFVKEIE